ncbi:MAG TPA: hypothetical protein VJT31_16245, partial [Rugosimonospora sp.]|nr:hypothetical protein [Rugosimonospora sp.]
GPVDGGGDGGVSIRPVRLLADQVGRPPLRLRVRYTVDVAGPAGVALDLLDRVLVALAGTDEYHHVPDAPAGESEWPTLVLDVPVRVDPRPAGTAVPRVTGELRLTGAAARTLHGRVLAPTGVPLAGMDVYAPGTGARVRTDERGTFTLPGQPADRGVALHLSGRGTYLRVDVAPQVTEPVTVYCDIEET